MSSKREIITKNIATLLHDGDFVNLGTGMPVLVGNYIPKDITVLLHGENGSVGQDCQLPDTWDIFSTKESALAWMRTHGDGDGDWITGHRDLCNAGDGLITLLPGACCFDSCMAFAIDRGGHLDATVLGGLQVDQEGNLANWVVPGQSVKGMGGAMDIVCGAKRVIIAMEHVTKTGEAKFVKKCTMPLTALACVDTLVTDLCMVDFTGGQPVVWAMAPGLTKEDLLRVTEAEISFAEEIQVMLT